MKMFRFDNRGDVPMVLDSKASPSIKTVWIQHRWGNRNLAALLCGNLELSSDFLPDGLKSGRE